MTREWVNRTFTFDFPVEVYPGLLERLASAPERAARLMAGVPRERLIFRPQGRWSAQRQIGHLADLDATLFLVRLDEYAAGAGILTPADLSNRATEEADHDERRLAEVLDRFRATRAAVMSRLSGFEPEMFGRTALHPRLRQPMRLVDQLHFQAEHDDHHLESAASILRAPITGPSRPSGSSPRS
jgi:hypothetical protein